MKRRDFLRVASGAAGGTAAAGAATAESAGDGSRVAQQTNATTTGGNATTTTGGGGGGGGETHTVDMNDQLQYVPQEITVAPGDTVVWENVGAVGHTVTAYEEDIPEGAAYFASGGFDSEDAARSGYPEGDIPGGESYEHTFETTGTHEYFCIPHETAGMVGTVTVQEGGGGGGGGGDAEFDPEHMGVPFQAHFVGIATVLMMVVSIIYTFFVVKYGESPNASSPGRD